MLLLILSGCLTARPGAPTTQVPREQATADYWYDQPDGVRVEQGSYDQLWAAAERVSRERFFELDRLDYRNGILTTQPMVSQQWFEPWRGDTTLGQQAESSLGTLRRTIRYELTRPVDEAPATLVAKVLIERQSVPQRRITSSAQYRSALFAADNAADDSGGRLQPSYWYAIGRDHELERVLSGEIRRQLRR